MRGLEKNCMGRGQSHKVSQNTQTLRLKNRKTERKRTKIKFIKNTREMVFFFNLNWLQMKLPILLEKKLILGAHEARIRFAEHSKSRVFKKNYCLVTGKKLFFKLIFIINSFYWRPIIEMS